MESIMDIKNLVKEYPRFSLSIDTLRIKNGSITGLIGRNGAGKTTLLNCLMNITKSSYDYYLFSGKEIKTQDYLFREDIGYVGDMFDAFQSIKLKDITSFYQAVYKNSWSFVKYKELIKTFDLDPSKKISELSKGMKVKYQLALVLSREIKLLLLDEPTSGLDPIVREDLLELLKQENQLKGVTVLFSTHITEDVERIATDLVFIHDGTIVLEGTVEQVKDRFKIANELPAQYVGSKGMVKQGDYYIVDKDSFGAVDEIELSDCDLSHVLIYMRCKKND